MPAAAPLPAAGALEAALLRFHVRQASNQWLYLHRVTAPWTEQSVTWNNFGAAYDPSPIDSVLVDAAGWFELPLTERVLAWGTGAESYHGLLLRHGALATPRSVIDSREDAASPPRLLLWMRGPTGLIADSLAAAADAFIWRAQPGSNYGDRNPLYAGWAQLQAGIEMQALLRFDLPVFPTTATLGDRVWLDADADGLQDPEEAGLGGITVELQDPLRRLLLSAVSDSSGAYAFADLEPGDYLLRVAAPGGLRWRRSPSRAMTLPSTAISIRAAASRRSSARSPASPISIGTSACAPRPSRTGRRAAWASGFATPDRATATGRIW